MKFFINPGTRSYLRELASEFGDSTNGIRVELNLLSKAKLLSIEHTGRTIQYSANTEHPLFQEIQNIVKKNMGIDKVMGRFLVCFTSEMFKD